MRILEESDGRQEADDAKVGTFHNVNWRSASPWTRLPGWAHQDYDVHIVKFTWALLVRTTVLQSESH